MTESTMFLRNTWYVAAWSNEIKHELFARTIVGESILFYRKQDGTAVAIGNRCPHRFAPLSRGKLVNDIVQCPYHGLHFDDSGMCVYNPHGDGKIPAKARVPQYPVCEQHDLIWLWIGEPELADEAKIPDFSCLADTQGFRTVGGIIEMHANYTLVIDNLMDLTHVEYVHEGTVGNEGIADGEHIVEQNGTTVYSKLWCTDTPIAPAWKPALGDYDGVVDTWLYMRWDAPTQMLLDVGVTPVGRSRSEGVWAYGTDILTPKDEHTTYYFWGISQNYALDDPTQDDAWRTSIEAAFAGQDKPMLEAQAAMMGDKSFDELDPVLLPSDRGPIRCRRILADLIEQQRQPEPAMTSLAELRSKEKVGDRVEPVV